MAKDKILNMIFKADDKASATIDQISGAKGEGGIGGITASLKGMINPATIATGAIAGLGMAVASAVSDWREHTMAVSDLTAMFDTTAEAASVLTQLMKDFDISADSMSGTMSALARNGFEPTVEGLIAVREELNTAGSATERLMMAQTLMGEQGVKEFLPMLDQLTNEQLRNYIDTMDEGNIVTEEQIEAARELELALSDLDDKWKGFTRNLVSETVPVMNDIVFVLGEFRKQISEAAGVDWFAIATPQLQQLITQFEQFSDGWESMADGIKRYNEYSEDHVLSIGENVIAHEEARQALVEESEAYDKLSTKQLYQLAAEAVLAGNYTLANKIMDDIDLLENQADRIQAVIDLLRELDGQDVTFEINGVWAGMGGPSGMDQGIPNPWAPGSSSGDTIRGWQMFEWSTQADRDWAAANPKPGFQHGGEFTIGGLGGPDSQLVQFMGTPGEPVKVGDGGDDGVAAEMRRLINTLPTMIRDAIARV